MYFVVSTSYKIIMGEKEPINKKTNIEWLCSLDDDGLATFLFQFAHLVKKPLSRDEVLTWLHQEKKGNRYEC